MGDSARINSEGKRSVMLSAVCNEPVSLKVVQEPFYRKGFSPFVHKQTGTWWEYDDDKKGFFDTGIIAQGRDGNDYVITEQDYNTIVERTLRKVNPTLKDLINSHKNTIELLDINKFDRTGYYDNSGIWVNSYNSYGNNGFLKIPCPQMITFKGCGIITAWDENKEFVRYVGANAGSQSNDFYISEPYINVALSVVNGSYQYGSSIVVKTNFGELSDRVNKNTMDIADINRNSSKLTFSIIGDSYSAYKDWIPNGYNPHYSDDIDSSKSDVNTVKNMWWYKLCKEKNLSLLLNGSYAGSPISKGIWPDIAFITRMPNDYGLSKATEQKPDIIFIFGGTNDDWGNVTVGTPKYSNWSEEDLKEVLPAFAYLVDYITLWNPQARIINIVNDILKADIKAGMATICEHYGVDNIELSNIEKIDRHPSVSGMESIKNQIIAIL